MYPTLPLDLPLPPSDALTRYFVSEPKDNRFQSCARLLQSHWREARGLPMGSYIGKSGEELPLGSRLRSDVAAAGHSFLSPDIARLARTEIAYREHGALIEEARAWGNLMSSTALAFNLFGPLKLDHTLAARVATMLTGEDITKVHDIRFETSPGRGQDTYTGDHTALDVLIIYTAASGNTAYVAIEVKYTEGSTSPAPTKRALPTRHAGFAKCLRNPDAAGLRKPLVEQFMREHLLCHAMTGPAGFFEHGHFIVVHPRQNADVSRSIESYAAELIGDASPVPFRSVFLEDVIAAVETGGAGGDQLGQALRERYLDFTPIHKLIRDWTPFQIA